jgi:hypothetical protein
VPADFLFVEKDGQVFRDLGGLIQIELDMQVIRGAATADFD